MKTWETPKLIVLVRGRPEEAILTNCKTGTDTLISGPYWYFQGCNNAWDAYLEGCIPWLCETLVSS